MTYPIADLDGITQDQIRLLKSLGIRSTEKLLDEACSANRRKRLAARTDISKQTWLSWANNADRMRIKGVGQDIARLLEEVGVVTVRELKYRNPAHLAQKMREANGKRKLMRLPPTEKAVERLIEGAKKLEPKIKY